MVSASGSTPSRNTNNKRQRPRSDHIVDLTDAPRSSQSPQKNRSRAKAPLPKDIEVIELDWEDAITS